MCKFFVWHHISNLLNPIDLLWSTLKSHIKSNLRKEMPVILNMEREANLSVTEQRMRRLEVLAQEAIGKVTPAMIYSFANRVERYYQAAARQEDLIEVA